MKPTVVSKSNARTDRRETEAIKMVVVGRIPVVHHNVNCVVPFLEKVSGVDMVTDVISVIYPVTHKGTGHVTKNYIKGKEKVLVIVASFMVVVVKVIANVVVVIKLMW